jgi:hypothetical protein
VTGSGSLLNGESDSTTMHAGNVHNANRYAVMAAENPGINTDEVITDFLSGEVTVTEYYAKRE